ncbi:MAG TPA: isocitrate lyase/PEP mutase family protein [Quisquiliibacterium sp.]|jgi:2-methylisocitrate lyase-like PEP mutase family enzyme|nr:isocitrate lyase/PEP mutase family protein [Quisquiliibacterium sp.]
MSAAQTLRSLLARRELIQAPGAPDPLTARLVERAGFPAVYMTGFGATAVRLGQPDLGLMTLNEMTGVARDMVRATRLPVIADADTGYGGVNNLMRTIEEYAQAGVAAIHLEDQTLPKRCGQLSGATLVSADEQVRRLKAARQTRGSHPMLLIGRTDALGVHGLEEALDRARRYFDAGADLVFVDGVKTIAQAEGIARGLEAPKVLSVVDGNETAALTAAQIQDLGFDIAFYALSTLFTAARAVADTLAALRRDGTTIGRADQMMTYAEFSEVVDLGRYQAFEQAFG